MAARKIEVIEGDKVKKTRGSQIGVYFKLGFI